MPLLDPEGRAQMKTAGRVGAVGIEMAVAICIGFFGGRWLDGHFGTAPILQYVGLVLGIAAAFRGLIRLVRKTDLDKL
jgi:F0F1-type ATP synthase assembly protein I